MAFLHKKNAKINWFSVENQKATDNTSYSNFVSNIKFLARLH